MSAITVTPGSLSEPKNILLLLASPRKDSTSTALAEAFLRPLAGHNITRVFLPETDVAPCIGCGGCDRGNPCPFNGTDEMGRLLSLIGEADGVILATPVYFLSLPASAKAFTDRLQQLYSRRFLLGQTQSKRIPCGLIITCGSENPEGPDALRRQAGMLLSTFFGRICCEYARTATDASPLSRADFQACEALGRDFGQALADGIYE
ncbi:MAG: flavodoxin family protein [Oscillospiraceae bacterium]|nr:flavodoxin family protein [Oscillospiraceae bacterium]